MKLKTGTWVVVADGGHATIFENEGTAIAPRLKMLRDYDEPHARTSDLGEDKPPRAFSPAGGRRASFEGADLHQVEEDRFIARIAHDLSLAATNKAFAHIVVVASPVALGNFRKAASHDLKDRVILWLDKDLTKHSVADITVAVTRALEDTAAG
ncbi:host attachment protein [Hyphomonas sp.]|jgi:protein required for attachment to host cells|uniref:host attachment protein n=1 Tax=Hyphomonas sp. TaxID=87 RepID=UPI0037C02E9F